MALANRLRAARCAGFVGRGPELSLIDRMLSTESEPRVLWIYGPGGIGKSTLVQACADRAAAASYTVSLVNMSALEPSAEAIMAAVSIGLATAGPHAILLDGVEAAPHLDDWLRTEFLPGLPDSAVAVIASRHPPGSGWLADLGWASELQPVRLVGFDPREVGEFLQRQNLSPDLADSIHATTSGHPLAVALASDILRQRPSTGGLFSAPDDRQHLVDSLLARFLDEVPDGVRLRALYALGQARTTTVSLLRNLLPADTAEDSFTWLAGLSFTQIGEEGVTPHDLVRRLLDEDLRWRDPDEAEALQSTIRRLSMERLLGGTPQDQQQAVDDLLWHHRHSGVLTGEWGHLEQPAMWVEPALATDLPGILELVTTHEGPESKRIHAAWWEHQPDAFLVARSAAERLGGFFVHLRLDLEHRALLDRVADPLARSAWDLIDTVAPLQGHEHLRVIRSWIGLDGYHQPTVSNQLFTAWTTRQILTERGLAATVAFAVGEQPWTTSYGYADYARAPEADRTVDATTFLAYVHDWRRCPPLEWLTLVDDRIAASRRDPVGTLREALAHAARHRLPDQGQLDESAFAQAVRQAFRDAGDPAALATNPLLDSRLFTERAATPEALVAMLRTEVQALAARPRRATAARALELTYLGGVRTQEAAAARLSLPFSTYRRHLATGLADVATALWAQAQRGGASVPPSGK
jgi:hypothetical protein